MLVILLARPNLTRKSKNLTVLVVLDRSQSISQELQEEYLKYLSYALGENVQPNQVAVVDVAETASISKLPSTDGKIRERNTTLTGGQTKLQAGIEMALAIAPPNTAVRILLVSEGNEVRGYSGCNRFTGSFEQQGSQLIFQQMASTSRACVEGMDQEMRFLKALNKTQKYEIQGDTLSLYDDTDRQIVHFEAVYLE